MTPTSEAFATGSHELQRSAQRFSIAATPGADPGASSGTSTCIVLRLLLLLLLVLPRARQPGAALETDRTISL